MRNNDVINLRMAGLSARNEQNLKTKAISAFFIVAIMIAAALCGFPYFHCLMALLSGVMCREWVGGQSHKNPPILQNVAIAGLVIAMFSVIQFRAFSCSSGTFLNILAIFFCGAVGLGACSKDRRIFVRFLLALYVFLSVSLFVRLYDKCGAVFVLWLFCVVWFSDTGAFLCGKKFGKSKLAPKISPSKTWEGFWGGTFLATLLVSLIWFFITFSMEAGLRIAIPTAILSVCSHLGDLIESAAKRYIGVKDMGNIIPGHGGVSDRFDSLLFVSLVAYSLLAILGITISS